MTEEQKEYIKIKKQTLIHQAAPFFEDAPCYKLEQLLQFQKAFRLLAYESTDMNIQEHMDAFEVIMKQMKKISCAPERVYLWNEENMPSLGSYTENENLRYNHDPDFRPYLYEILIDEQVQPKGAVIVCAGADHGECTLHEGYQTCLDLCKVGYQCFLLLNRPNHCPYDAKEAGVDAARAVQLVRMNADKYRIDRNQVAFAGFSNGGLTAEACVQYFSGTQTIRRHFEKYQPEEADQFYSAPDAILNIYGPRFENAPFDYTNVVYPPTFFAVGREDAALKNLNAMVPDLLKHHVEVEVHTFSGVPHGQSGITIYGVNSYPHFQLWLSLADAFMQNVFAKSVVKKAPDKLEEPAYRYDAFSNGKALLNKKKGHLPAMGWNSWNAFGSGNTENLTKEMADAMVRLELNQLGYQYIVLDDGCYKPVRVEGRLANEEKKFPNGFKALSDYIHNKGLKFGMYNDIGTNLCAGAAVGTCGHEAVDSKSYLDWGVDFLKVDNCYYLWDNATFSDAANAKYVYAPNLKGCTIAGEGMLHDYSAVRDGVICGNGIRMTEDYVTGIGTFDGTGPEQTPVGMESGELHFTVTVEKAGSYDLTVTYATAMEAGCGSWLQVAVREGEYTQIYYDDFMPASPNSETFITSGKITIKLEAGTNTLRFMNHRRQENTLSSYAALLEGLNKANPGHDVILSICEWGKTQPQNWGYKVGDSWRILNDITFQVGCDGNPGRGAWTSGYTTGVTAQYNKAVIMDEFCGPDKGYNDPDMLMIGMDGMSPTMNKTHMTMWCMMNSPLMLGMDLRRVQKGDILHRIIANKDIVALNQDSLGVACKRIFTTYQCQNPDTDYIRDNNRIDILAKPLSDGSIAVSFINLSEETRSEGYSIDVAEIIRYLGHKMLHADRFQNAQTFNVKDLWKGSTELNKTGVFTVPVLEACDNVTLQITPVM